MEVTACKTKEEKATQDYLNAQINMGQAEVWQESKNKTLSEKEP